MGVLGGGDVENARGGHHVDARCVPALPPLGRAIRLHAPLSCARNNSAQLCFQVTLAGSIGIYVSRRCAFRPRFLLGGHGCRGSAV